MKHIFIFLLCIISFSILTNAQPGTPDKNFGDNGKLLCESFEAGCDAIAIQKDGKIVTAAYGFTLARLNADGTTDETFGEKGKVTVRYRGPETPLSVYALTIQTDGKIIAAGRFIANKTGDPHGDVGMIRYNENGSLDSTFGINGIVIKSFAYEDGAYDLAIQTDGKIIVTGGLIDNKNSILAPFIARFNANGSIDTGFGENGIASNSQFSEISTNAIKLQSDNKIVIAGVRRFARGYAAIRYFPDGTLDEEFGNNGLAILSLDEKDDPYATIADITIQSDGKIVTTGTVGNTFFLLAVARFKSNGEVDKSFGEEKGYTFLRMNAGYSKGQTIKSGNENKIIVTGSYVDGVNVWFGAFQFNDDGLIDSSFGENGMALAGFDISENAGARTGIVQEDGKILVGGGSNPDRGNARIALVRYNGGKLNSQPEFAKIKKWQGHYGFTWNDWPGNKTTYYSVGRSTNASTFSEIAQVADIPGQKKYQFEDPAPPAGIVYYQLTAVRCDGKTVSSNIISAGTAVTAIKLFPNPAKNSLRIEGLHSINKTKLTIVDVSGNIKVAATATGSSHTINIGQLKPGNYMLRMETNGNVVTRMFVKE